jgi:hypothetical protein
MPGQTIGPGIYKKVTLNVGKMVTNTSVTPFDNIFEIRNPPKSVDRLTCAGFDS